MKTTHISKLLKRLSINLSLLSLLIVPVSCSLYLLSPLTTVNAQKKSPKKTLKQVKTKKSSKTKPRKTITKVKKKKTTKTKKPSKPSKSTKTLKRRSKPNSKAVRTKINPTRKRKSLSKTRKPKGNLQKVSPRSSSRVNKGQTRITKGKKKIPRNKSNPRLNAPKRRIVGSPASAKVKDGQRQRVDNRSGKTTTVGQPSTKTTTTTTTTTSRKKTRTSKRVQKKSVSRKSSTSNTVYQDRTINQGTGYGSGGYGGGYPAPTGGMAGGMRRPVVCRPQGGKLLLNLGFGTQTTQGLDDSKGAYILGLGYRSDMIGLVAEGQFASYDDAQQFTSMRGQLRLYLPIGQCVDIYPLVGLSRFQEDNEQTPAIDLGVGADLNLGGSISLGARYTRSFFTDSFENIRNEDVVASNTVIFQLGLYF